MRIIKHKKGILNEFTPLGITIIIIGAVVVIIAATIVILLLKGLL